MQSVFFHFMNQEFIYENKVSDMIWGTMSAADKALFPFDTRNINWTLCLQGF